MHWTEFTEHELVTLASHLWAGATLQQAVLIVQKERWQLSGLGRYAVNLDDVWDAYVQTLIKQQKALIKKLDANRSRSLESPTEFN